MSPAKASLPEATLEEISHPISEVLELGDYVTWKREALLFSLISLSVGESREFVDVFPLFY